MDRRSKMAKLRRIFSVVFLFESPHSGNPNLHGLGPDKNQVNPISFIIVVFFSAREFKILLGKCCVFFLPEN